LALCTAIATGILVAVAPWSDSPNFLARAAAALAPPPDAVLYERWEHLTTPEPKTPAFKEATTFGPDQLWIQDGPPHSYRAILEPGQQAASQRAGLANMYGVNLAYGSAKGGNSLLNYLLQRLAGRRLEMGGALEGPEQTKAHPNLILRTLTLVAPNELLSAHLQVTLGAMLPGPHDDVIENVVDPVSALRSAISEGRAHQAGTAQLNGRTAERIDFDLPNEPSAEGPPLPMDAPVVHREAYAYVEPETFHPVEIVFGRDAYRFLAYGYLPATTANLALTDIQAQHPHATIVNADAATVRRRPERILDIGRATAPALLR